MSEHIEVIMGMDVLWGLIASGLVAGLAYRKRSLSLSGALAAVGVGTILVAFGTIVWFGLLLVFFVSSSALSRWKRRSKGEAEGVYEKTGRRDAGQVLANGGIGALLCVLYVVEPSPLWWYAFVGVMASVNADTWATEVGGLSRSLPRHIRTGRTVQPGTSGGVTPLGLGASAAGGLCIGLSAWLLERAASIWVWSFGESTVLGLRAGWIERTEAARDGGVLLLMLGLVGGMAGSLSDSWLGATVQRIRRCRVCGREVERSEHCGQPTDDWRGWRWFNNDTVNVVSSVIGGLAAVVVGMWLK
jgi:uncharacterized protein (TIGR00297 family)